MSVSADKKNCQPQKCICFWREEKRKINSFWEQSESEMKDTLKFSVASKAECEKMMYVIHLYCSQT